MGSEMSPFYLSSSQESFCGLSKIVAAGKREEAVSGRAERQRAQESTRTCKSLTWLQIQPIKQRARKTD